MVILGTTGVKSNPGSLIKDAASGLVRWSGSGLCPVLSSSQKEGEEQTFMLVSDTLTKEMSKPNHERNVFYRREVLSYINAGHCTTCRVFLLLFYDKLIP